MLQACSFLLEEPHLTELTVHNVNRSDDCTSAKLGKNGKPAQENKFTAIQSAEVCWNFEQVLLLLEAE